MKIQKVSIPVDGQQIRGTLFFPEILHTKNPAVLFIHGWNSKEDGYFARAAAVVQYGAIALTINLRGHGTSDGDLEDFSRKDHLKDAITAYDFLASQEGVDKTRIGVVGASYGGYLASILSSKRKIKYLVFRAPALYQDRDFDVPTAYLIRADEEVYRQTNLSAKNNIALQAISIYFNYFLLVESELDDICPQEITNNYYTAISSKARKDYQIIEGAGHNLKSQISKQAFIDILSDWFGRVLFP